MISTDLLSVAVTVEERRGVTLLSRPFPPSSFLSAAVSSRLSLCNSCTTCMKRGVLKRRVQLLADEARLPITCRLRRRTSFRALMGKRRDGLAPPDTGEAGEAGKEEEEE